MGWDTSAIGGLIGTDHMLYLRLRAGEAGRSRVLGDYYWTTEELAGIILGMAMNATDVERRALWTATVTLGVAPQVAGLAQTLRKAGYPPLLEARQ